MKRWRRPQIGILLAAVATVQLAAPPAHGETGKVILWAWQRAENLQHLPPNMAVAFLACQITLTGNSANYYWRQQPLKLSPATELIAVVRIDDARLQPPSLTDEQARMVAQAVARAGRMGAVRHVQIDYDARKNERRFYAILLRNVRAILPAETKLSITALASWCLFDDWVKDLPVDESVPMMFSLGSERQKIIGYFRSGRDFMHPPCCQSLGISLEDAEINQLMIPLAKARKIPVRLYVYTRTAWTPEKINKIQAMLE
jgi:hypothetical protein